MVAATLVVSAPGQLVLAPFGTLLFDLSAPWAIVGQGAIPSTQVLPLPAGLAGASLGFQSLAFDSAGNGNTSNVVWR